MNCNLKVWLAGSLWPEGTYELYYSNKITFEMQYSYWTKEELEKAYIEIGKALGKA